MSRVGLGNLITSGVNYWPMPETPPNPGLAASPEPNPANPKPLPSDQKPPRRFSIAEFFRRFAGTFVWVIVAAAAFHAAYAWPAAGFLIVVYLFALLQLARRATWRKAYYSGLAVGLLIAAVRLEFFWRIFSAGAIALWYVYAFWIALFVALTAVCLRRWGTCEETGVPALSKSCVWLLIPFLWAGLEYFRSELYYLRFSWLSPGYAFAGAPWQVPMRHVGAYGLGFLLMGIASAAAWAWQKSKAYAVLSLAIGTGLLGFWGWARPTDVTRPVNTVRIAGVQMEQPTEPEVLNQLHLLVRKYPDTELIVLSEFTFNDPIPEKVKEWCRKNRRYLIVGGTEPAPRNNFYNTAFVIGPEGNVVFKQVKCVPIQFFKDGLPAPSQKLWESPWGKLGICICYDLSYARVTDRLVAMGAQALIVPTMDVMDWGERQHELHARVAPTRAAEYGIPIYRLASSGISQFVSPAGRVVATAPCPGGGAVLATTLELRDGGSRPLDRWLAPFAVGVTGFIMLLLLWPRGVRLVSSA
jgi:apolipoprotein N-acyltransferase